VRLFWNTGLVFFVIEIYGLVPSAPSKASFFYRITFSGFFLIPPFGGKSLKMRIIGYRSPFARFRLHITGSLCLCLSPSAPSKASR